MTTPHSSLTGLDLHEPKGADSASANQVYVANGLGGGTWQKLDGNSLATTANPFGKQLLHVQEQQTPTTASAVSAITATTWTDRTFTTTITNEIAGSSVSTVNITLPAGTYYCEAYAVFNGGDGSHKLRVYDATTPVVLIEGLTTHATSTYNSTVGIRGRFTLPLTKVIRLNHYSSVSGSGGVSVGGGSVEVYAEFLIWKLA